MKFATKLLHGTACGEKFTGSTTFPIYQTAAYRQETAEDLEKIFSGRKAGFVYTRAGNPTVANFERRMAELENGLSAVAFSSGMAAIAAAIMNVVEVGDEIIASSSLFGGTLGLFKDLASFGVKIRYTNENFAELITPKTKLLYVETIGNPKLEVADLKALATLAHENKLLFMVDNTITTSSLCRPLDFGADVVIHSTSKMINGGGNAIGGLVITGKNFSGKAVPKLAAYEKFGVMSYLARLRSNMLMNYGGCAAPFNIFLTETGLDTLSLRMERACQNALTLAEILSVQKKIRVNYPGLKGNPYRKLAAEQFDNRFGTMLTINFDSKEQAFKFINSLRFALNESNIGDVRTLAIHPASTIYLNATAEEKLNAGVTEGLVRISTGIEDIEDLTADFLAALRKI
jgi:O-acetylhomoserine (thiol)-lyase